MKVFFRKDGGEIWDAFLKKNQHHAKTVDGKIVFGGPLYPEAVQKINELQPLDRHIPIPESVLKSWESEVMKIGSCGEILKKDISWARKCNNVGSELLVSMKD